MKSEPSNASQVTGDVDVDAGTVLAQIGPAPVHAAVRRVRVLDGAGGARLLPGGDAPVGAAGLRRVRGGVPPQGPTASTAQGEGVIREELGPVGVEHQRA